MNIINVFRDKGVDWRPDERFSLRKLLQSSSYVSPAKDFKLPSYAEKSAKRQAVEKSPLILWGKKGRRSFSWSTKYVDDEAEETDREESSSVSRSEESDESSQSTESDEVVCSLLSK